MTLESEILTVIQWYLGHPFLLEHFEGWRQRSEVRNRGHDRWVIPPLLSRRHASPPLSLCGRSPVLRYWNQDVHRFQCNAIFCSYKPFCLLHKHPITPSLAPRCCPRCTPRHTCWIFDAMKCDLNCGHCRNCGSSAVLGEMRRSCSYDPFLAWNPTNR